MAETHPAPCVILLADRGCEVMNFSIFFNFRFRFSCPLAEQEPDGVLQAGQEGLPHVPVPGGETQVGRVW